MKKIIKRVSSIVLGLASASFLVAGFAGLILAFTSNGGSTASSGLSLTSSVTLKKTSSQSSHSKTTIAGSTIPRSVYYQDRLNAMAKVLNTTTSNIQSAMHNKSLKNLVKSANLSPKQFAKAVRADFISQLKASGYPIAEITIAHKQVEINHLRHEIKVLKG